MGSEQLDLGSAVSHGGRDYLFRGYSRLSLSATQYVYLEDVETGNWLTVALSEIQVPALPGDEPSEPLQ